MSASLEAAIAALKSAFRDYQLDGVPASDLNPPIKAEVRAALTDLLTALQAAISAAGGNMLRFRTLALRDAATGEYDGQLAYVFRNNDDPADPANGIYQWDQPETDWVAAEWYLNAVAAIGQPLLDAALAAATAAEGHATTAAGLVDDAEQVIADVMGPGANLHDPSGGILPGRAINPANGQLVTSSVRRVSAPVPVVPGQQYTISGVGPTALRVGAFPTAATTTSYQGVYLGELPAGPVTRYATFTIPADMHFLRFELASNASTNDAFDASASVALGASPTYFPFQRQVKASALTERLKDWLLKDGAVYQASFNMIDPAQCDFVNRYSTGTKTFTTDASGIAASNRMRVEEGQTYTLSGEGLWPYDGSGNLGAMQGGFFTSKDAPVAVSNIVFSGAGNVRRFTVPEGSGIKYAVVSLSKAGGSPGATTLRGTVQCELGAVNTPIVAYSASQQLDPAMIPAYLARSVIAGIGAATSTAASALVAATAATAIASASVAGAVDQPALADPVELAGVNHVLQIGQSLGIGANSGPLIDGHTVPYDDHFITWQGGPKARPVEFGGATEDTASFKPLVEDENSPDSDVGTIRGETGLRVAAQTLAQRIFEKTGSYGGAGDWLFTSPGDGGEGIGFFAKSEDPGSWWQTRFLPTIRQARIVANGLSKTYAVHTIQWVQGEASLGVPPATYAETLRDIFNDMADAVMAETEQLQPPNFVTYVTGYATREGDPVTVSRGGTLGQVAAIWNEYGDADPAQPVHLGPCVYALPHAADDIHLVSAGYAGMGRVFGEALADLYEGIAPRRIKLDRDRVFIGGGMDEIILDFDITGGVFTLDTVDVPVTDQMGFKVTDGTGDAPVLSVEAQGNRVKLSLARTVAGATTVDYAQHFHAVGSPTGPSVATGNLRLSPSWRVDGVSSYKAHLWCPPFSATVAMPTVTP